MKSVRVGLGSNGAEVTFIKGQGGFAAYVQGQEGAYHLSDEASVQQVMNDLGSDTAKTVLDALKSAEANAGVSIVIFVQSLKKSPLNVLPYSNDPNARVLRLLNLAMPGNNLRFVHADDLVNDFGAKSTVANLSGFPQFGGLPFVQDLNQDRNIYGSVMGAGDSVKPMFVIVGNQEQANNNANQDNIRTLGEDESGKGGIRTL